jgi:DNA-binding CsgD family transcriptional regulator
LELSIRHGFTLWAHNFHTVLGLLAASRGDVESAREFCRIVDRWAASRASGYHLSGSARSLALAALSESDYESAYEHASRVSPAGSIAAHSPHAPWVVLDLVDAAVHTGRLEEARAHVAAAEHAQLAKTSPRLRLLVAAAEALVAPEGQAVDLYQHLLALPRIEQWPFDQARIRLAFGQLHRRNHRPGDARPELRRAADIFSRIGASAWQQHAEQELRATGVALAPVRATRSSTTGRGIDELTAQQLEVAQLAASGLSNKEIGAQLFLSPRTVSAHLYRVFPKLGISSRSALRDALEVLD